MTERNYSRKIKEEKRIREQRDTQTEMKGQKQKMEKTNVSAV
jgi:hypothetical protein